MTVKEQLLKKTAEDVGQPEDIVNAVIAWGYRDVTKAVKIHEEIEISGFGKFMISQAKLKRRIKSLERTLGNVEKAENVVNREIKIESLKNILNFYYSKLKDNEFQTNIRGMAKSGDSSEGNEGTDSQGGHREVRDLQNL